MVLTRPDQQKAPAPPKRVGLLFVVGLIGASAIAELLSVHYDTTLANIFTIAPLMLLIPALWAKVPVLGWDAWALAGLLLLGFSVMPFQEAVRSDSAARLMAYAFYVVYYLITYRLMYRYPIAINYVWAATLSAALLVLIVSNMANPHIGFTPHYVAFVRYHGLLGPNAHGITSALGIMAATALGSLPRKPVRSLMLVLIWLYCLTNLWPTGSRASMLTVLVFWAALAVQWRKGFTIAVALALIIFSGLVVLLIGVFTGGNGVEWAKLQALLRLDEYSVQQRVEPLLWAIGQIVNNHGLPYGIGVMNASARAQRLDNSFLMIGLELGVFGLLLLGVFVLCTIRSAWRLVRLDATLSSEERYFRYINAAAIVALGVHGLFETYLLSSFHVGTLQFLASSAWLNARARMAYHLIGRARYGLGDSENVEVGLR